MKKHGPKWLAYGLLAGYVGAILALFLRNREEPYLLFVQILFGIPWIVAPAVAAAWLVGTAYDPVRSWGGLALETAVIGSTVLLVMYLTQNPDAQNGLAFLWWPLVQVGGLVAGWLGLVGGQRLLGRWRRQPRRDIGAGGG